MVHKKINETTFKHVVRDTFEDRLEIEIGDSKQPDFKPQIKIMGWDNEVNFSVRMTEDNSNIQVIEDGDKILMDKEDLQLQFFDFEANDEYPEGAYKFEYIIKKKPASNILNFTMQSKKLDFFYQPEITDEEAQKLLDLSENWTGEWAENKPTNLLEAKRRIRPENVVGSYAVYHKTKKNNINGGKHYKDGRVFQIYRPKIIDSTGEWVWGDLKINENDGTYVVTIPQEFLDSAVYPIKSNDTFGYDVVDHPGDFFINPTMLGNLHEAPEDGQITSINSDAMTPTIKAAVYNEAGSLLGVSESQTSGGLNEFTPSISITGGQKYWLMIQTIGTFISGPSAAIAISPISKEFENASGNPVETLPGTSGTKAFLLFATYTPGGEPEPENPTVLGIISIQGVQSITL